MLRSPERSARGRSTRTTLEQVENRLLRLLDPGKQILICRMRTNAREIRIVAKPLGTTPTKIDRFVEKVDRTIRITDERGETGNVVKCADLIRIDFDCTVGAFFRLVDISKVKVRQSCVLQRSRITWAH